MHRSRSAHTAWVQPFCLLSFELEHKYPRGGSKFLFSYWLLNVTNCGLCISILFCFKPEMCFFGKHFVKIYNKHFLFFLYWVDYYGCPQLSHQIQITHIKYKILTSNTNYSHQKQIAHIKYKLLTTLLWLVVYSRPFTSKAVFWAILKEFEFAVDCSL